MSNQVNIGHFSCSDVLQYTRYLKKTINEKITQLHFLMMCAVKQNLEEKDFL